MPEKNKSNDFFLNLIVFIFSRKIYIFIIFLIILLFIQPYRVTVVDSAEIGIKFYKYSSDESKNGLVVDGFYIINIQLIYLDILYLFKERIIAHLL